MSKCSVRIELKENLFSKLQYSNIQQYKKHCKRYLLRCCEKRKLNYYFNRNKSKLFNFAKKRC